MSKPQDYISVKDILQLSSTRKGLNLLDELTFEIDKLNRISKWKAITTFDIRNQKTQIALLVLDIKIYLHANSRIYASTLAKQ